MSEEIRLAAASPHFGGTHPRPGYYYPRIQFREDGEWVSGVLDRPLLEGGYVQINGVSAARLAERLLPYLDDELRAGAEAMLAEWGRWQGTPRLRHNRARYNKGCRCATCRKANREYQRARYKPTGQNPGRPRKLEGAEATSAAYLGR